jgi:peroxiredoxin family protein
MGNTLNLIVLSGDYAKIHAAAMVTMVAGSLGQRVNIFVSMEAMTGFHRDDAVRSRLGRGPIGDLIVKSGGRDYQIRPKAPAFTQNTERPGSTRMSGRWS